jgi:hypothetical protein
MRVDERLEAASVANVVYRWLWFAVVAFGHFEISLVVEMMMMK